MVKGGYSSNGSNMMVSRVESFLKEQGLDHAYHYKNEGDTCDVMGDRDSCYIWNSVPGTTPRYGTNMVPQWYDEWTRIARGARVIAVFDRAEEEKQYMDSPNCRAELAFCQKYNSSAMIYFSQLSKPNSKTMAAAIFAKMGHAVG